MIRLPTVAVPKHRRILGEMIRRHRKEAGLSQETLAEKAELSSVFISHIERDVENISVDALARIATALKVRITDLFGGI